MKELHFGAVQDAIEMFLESITIGFEPARFAIYIAIVKVSIMFDLLVVMPIDLRVYYLQGKSVC